MTTVSKIRDSESGGFRQIAFVHSCNIEIFESQYKIFLLISKNESVLFYSDVTQIPRPFLELFCNIVALPMPMLASQIQQAKMKNPDHQQLKKGKLSDTVS